MIANRFLLILIPLGISAMVAGTQFDACGQIFKANEAKNRGGSPLITDSDPNSPPFLIIANSNKDRSLLAPAMLERPKPAGELGIRGVVDTHNQFPNVGALMVFADPNPLGIPEGLAGFCSGTLIHERVLLTAGHCTGPAKSGVPPFIHVFVSLNFNALDPSTWIPVEAQITHPSLPPCPPPIGCDPTSTGAFEAGDPNIVDLGLVFLSRPVQGIEPADLATPMTLESPKAAGAPMTFVGYGFPEPRGSRPLSEWDGLRKIKVSTIDNVLNHVWASWSLPSRVCSGDSGGATFFNRHPRACRNNERLAAVASDGGIDCMSKDIRVRLDSRAVQKWIRQTIKEQLSTHQ